MLVRDTILTEYTGNVSGFTKAARVYDETLARQARLTDRRLSEVDRRWERSNRAVLLTRTSIVGLTAALGASQVRAYAEAWRSVERSLTSIGAAGAENQQALIDLALRTRSEVGSTAKAVQRLAKSTDGDLDTTIRRVETLQKLLASGGASTTESASVSLQLGQALQSGVLSGDEFASIRENAPVEFLDALAGAAGIARSELRGFAEEQRLTSDIVLRALDGMADAADANFRRLAVSGEEAIATLSTGLTAYVGRIDEALGATATINGAMVAMGEYMSNNTEGAEWLATAIRFVAAAAVAGAGGRGIGAMVESLRAASQARHADVQAARAQVAASRQAVIDQRVEIATLKERRRVAETEFAQRSFQGKSTVNAAKARKRAIEAESRAIARLAALEGRAAAATQGLTAAQKRLSIAVRFGTAALNSLKSALAFFGGPIGLAFTAITTTLLVMATRTSDVERLTQNVTDRVSDLQAAYAAVGGEIDEVRQKMAGASLAQAITDAEELGRLLGDAQDRAGNRFSEPMFQGLLGKNPELKELIDGLVSGRLRASEFQGQLNELVAQSGDGFARMLQIFEPVLQPLIEAAQRSEKASDVLLVLRGSADEAAEAMDRLGLGAEGVSKGINQVAGSAEAAARGIAGLVAQIPELAQAAEVQEKLAQAARDRDAALAGLNDPDLSGLDRIEEERRILALYEQSTAEINGSAKATRDADKALKDYLDQSKLSGLSAREQALAREEARYQAIVDNLKAAQAGEAELTAAAEANARNRAAIEAEHNKRGRGGVSADTKADLRDLSQLREVLIEGGQREVYIEQALNAERQRLADLMPTLIEMGYSRADAEALVADQLARVKDRLGEVKTESEKAAQAFARSALRDIRAADSVGDAIGRIGQRLADLATDRAFDALAQQFANLFAPAGAGSNVLNTFFGSLFGGGTAGTAAAPIAPARASGGPVRGGSLYKVNENTPNSEYWYAPQNGAILNVHQAQEALRDTGAMASQVVVRGGDMSIHIHNHTSAKVTTERRSDGRLDITMREQLKAEILSGSLDGAFSQRFGSRAKPMGA
jgi:tape measure domain-containing protein